MQNCTRFLIPLLLSLLAILAGEGLYFSPVVALATEITIVDGVAPVIDGDLPQARDEALADARLRAVEQAAGIRVESRTVLSHELMVSDEFKSEARGVLLGEKVLSQGLGGDGLYHLRLRATVSKDEAKNRLKQLLRKDSIVLVIQEKNLERPMEVPFLENRIRSELVRMGYGRVVSLRAGQSSWGVNPDAFDRNTAEAAGITHLADVAIVGRIKSRASSRLAEGLYSAHADGWLHVFQIREGRMLSSVHVEAMRGYGPDIERAGRNALADVATELSSRALRQITPRSVREMKVVILDIPDFHAFKIYKNLLANMRWVQQVRVDSYNQVKSVFEIGFAESPEILASRLARFRDFEVQGFDAEEIRVRVVP
jgi:hypothetical protein